MKTNLIKRTYCKVINTIAQRKLAELKKAKVALSERLTFLECKDSHLLASIYNLKRMETTIKSDSEK